MPAIAAFKYLAIGTMHLETLSGAGSNKFNKNFRKIGIQAQLLLNLFRNTNTGRKKNLSDRRRLTILHMDREKPNRKQ